MKLDEKTIEKKYIYKGRIINVRTDTAELPNGKQALREVVEHPGGVTVAALTDNDELMFVRQFRYPYSEVLLELPAGKLEYGEDPFEAGKRELREGLDRVPADYMEAHGIKVFNARGVYSAPMAEFAVCSVLGFYKRSAFFSAAQSEHRWEKHRGLEELGGKRVVIVGAGSVGRACADRFRAFGCEIIGVDRKTDVDGFDKIYSISDIRAAVSAGDIVIFCLPLTKETEHIANAELLCAMKDGAVIVNISRGGIIDTDALITELKSGRLRAALDVFEQEPLDAGSELWDLPNAVITPHNSFVGDGNRARLFSLIISNLK